MTLLNGEVVQVGAEDSVARARGVVEPHPGARSRVHLSRRARAAHLQGLARPGVIHAYIGHVTISKAHALVE
jgi:hypothetical protein